jgi:hypothetical protein
VTLIARQSSIDIKSRSLEEKENSANANFLMQLESEVKANPRRAKKLKTLLSATATMCVSMLIVAQPTMAASIVPSQPNIDPDLINTLIILMLTCAGLGVLASVVGLMMAGIWRMFFGGKQADEWRQNIYRGLGQVLLAPVTVALIVGLALLLFSSLPAFRPLVRPIQAWFQM